jgi:hypothetical protein
MRLRHHWRVAIPAHLGRTGRSRSRIILMTTCTSGTDSFVWFASRLRVVTIGSFRTFAITAVVAVVMVVVVAEARLAVVTSSARAGGERRST